MRLLLSQDQSGPHVYVSGGHDGQMPNDGVQYFLRTGYKRPDRRQPGNEVELLAGLKKAIRSVEAPVGSGK